MALTLQKKFNRFPPIVCRLLAREGTSNKSIQVLSDEDISSRSSLSVAEVKSLSWLTTWDNTTIRTMFSFTKACGVDLSSRYNMNLHAKYLQGKRRFSYLKKHPEWKSRWAPMINLYSEYLMEKYAAGPSTEEKEEVKEQVG